MINILNLGAGVQSTALLLMSIKGELPKLDYAIFSDTGWEPKKVYDNLEKQIDDTYNQGKTDATFNIGGIADILK